MGWPEGLVSPTWGRLGWVTALQGWVLPTIGAIGGQMRPRVGTGEGMVPPLGHLGGGASHRGLVSTVRGWCHPLGDGQGLVPPSGAQSVAHLGCLGSGVTPGDATLGDRWGQSPGCCGCRGRRAGRWGCCQVGAPAGRCRGDRAGRHRWRGPGHARGGRGRRPPLARGRSVGRRRPPRPARW